MGTNTDASAKAWKTRRKRGGKYNSNVVDENGRIREDAIVIDKDTGCWIWQYGFRKKAPTAADPEGGAAPISVRKYVYEKTRHSIDRAYAGCGDFRCVNPDHATRETTRYATAQIKFEIEAYAKSHQSLSSKEIAERMGVSRDSVYATIGGRRLSRTGRKWAGRSLPKQPESIDDRRWDMFKRVARGESMKDVADDYGLSRERIRGVCNQVELAINGARRARRVQRKHTYRQHPGGRAVTSHDDEGNPAIAIES